MPRKVLRFHPAARPIRRKLKRVFTFRLGSRCRVSICAVCTRLSELTITWRHVPGDETFPAFADPLTGIVYEGFPHEGCDCSKRCEVR